jgi:hypothetical protein
MCPKSQKKDKKIYETFKGSSPGHKLETFKGSSPGHKLETFKGFSPGHKLETFKYETFFKFRRAEKGFVGKMRNL